MKSRMTSLEMRILSYNLTSAMDGHLYRRTDMITKDEIKYSNCCGAPDCGVDYDGPTFSTLGMCPQCHEYCEFEPENEGDEL